mgnify:CR=1 FL=1
MLHFVYASTWHSSLATWWSFFLHSNASNNSTQGTSSQENKNQHKRERNSKHADPKGTFKAEVLGSSEGASTSEVEGSTGDGEADRVLNCKDDYAF